MRENSVVVENLWKMLGYKWVLKRVNLEVPKSTVAFITGPNGSGKSTLLKIIGGLWRPTRGSVRVLNKNPLSVEAKDHIGIVLHENVLYEELSVRENLEFYSKFYSSNSLWSEVLEVLGLNAVLNKRVGELSFGWKRRANIARAVLHKPEILVIDEPFTGLDTLGRRAVVEVVREITRLRGVVLAAAPVVDEELLREVETIVYEVRNGQVKRVK